MEDTLNSEQCARYLKALSDPWRIKILCCLQNGCMSVSEIASALEIDLANASHHLRVMHHANLLSTRREGKFIYYSLSEEICDQNGEKLDSLNFGCCQLSLNLSPEKVANAAESQSPV